mgnify:CR=1 FL=1
MKKKKIARTINATAAEPNADKIPIKMPLPVEPLELPLASIGSGWDSIDKEEMTFCRFAWICCCESDVSLCVGVGNGSVEETKPIGDVVGLPITVLRVDGRPASAPGLGASGPCIVHASSKRTKKEKKSRDGEILRWGGKEEV